jgi:membrane-bound ClpP family serine protease
MLFLFRGHNAPVVRAVIGAVLLAIGLVLPHGALLAGIGAVLLVWGGIGALSSLRAHRRGHAGNSGRAS